MKLREKERHGSHTTKRYDEPKTPYERLMAAPNVSEKQKKELEARFKHLNPFELKQGLEQRLNHFFSLVKKSRDLRKVA